MSSTPHETRALPPSWGDPDGGVSGEGLLQEHSSLARLSRFGPYRVVRILAKGGMGAVFEVEHAELGARYALKTILGAPGTPAYAQACERFRREAELSARFDHPHILSVHSAQLGGDHPYIVVDLLEGGSLGERLERAGALTLEEVLPLARALVSALRHAHGRGVLHRDLKPENVMFDALGGLRLVDFGLALELDRESRLTQSGAVVGTPLTMAPEQLTGERGEGPSTDVYGLAATLYWVLLGEPPLGSDGLGITALVAAVISRVPIPLAKRRAGIPRALSDLIQASLRKDPRARPSLETWEQVLAGRGVQARSRLPSLLLGGAGALSALCLGGALILGRGADLSAPPPTQASASSRPSPPRSWREACAQAWAAGEPAAARLALLSSGEALSEAEVPLALALLLDPPLTPAELEALRPRLRSLAERSGPPLWVALCVSAERAELGLRLARRGSEARELIDLELLRLRAEREQVIPLLTTLRLASERGDAVKAFEELSAGSVIWGPQRRRPLSPAEARLAELVLDRVQGTLAGLCFELRQSERVHDTGLGTRAEGQRILNELALPPGGPGQLLLRLFLASEQSDAKPLDYALWREASAAEEVLVQIPGGLVLLGTHALRYASRPEVAIRLGQPAHDQVQPLGDISRHAQALAPYLVRRRLEAAWLAGPEEGAANLALAEDLVLRRIATRHRDAYPALLCLRLHKRELGAVRPILAEAEELRRDWMSEFELALDLAESELLLAEDPAGNAAEVLRRHTPPRAHYIEEWGLRAHAQVLLGQSPAADLAEQKRRRAAGCQRLGFAWHAFEVEAVLAGERWWPGLAR